MSTIQELFDNWNDAVEYSAGAVVISQDTQINDLFLVLSGEIELSLHGKPLGKESTGGIIGEMAMIGSSTGNPTAQALTDVVLARMSRDQFNHMIATHPEFSLHALTAMARRLRAMNSFIDTQLESRE